MTAISTSAPWGVGGKAGDGEGDALDGDGALADDVAGELRREGEGHAPVGGVEVAGVDGLHG